MPKTNRRKKPVQPAPPAAPLPPLSLVRDADKARAAREEIVQESIKALNFVEGRWSIEAKVTPTKESELPEFNGKFTGLHTEIQLSVGWRVVTGDNKFPVEPYIVVTGTLCTTLEAARTHLPLLDAVLVYADVMEKQFKDYLENHLILKANPPA